MHKRWSPVKMIPPERTGNIPWQHVQLATTCLILIILFNFIEPPHLAHPNTPHALPLFPAIAAQGDDPWPYGLAGSTHFTPLSWPLYRGNPSLPEIALTFDDGPHPGSTPRIVAILKHFGINATFFCVGQLVQRYPEYVRQEFANGNLVEDHTWTHPDLQILSYGDITRQLTSTAREIQRVTGTMPTLFRPPYGLFNWSIFAQARRMAMTSVIWSVDPEDWSMPGTNAIISRVLSRAGNGSIVLMHDGGGDRSQTVAALPIIITTLRQRGFRFVTIEQMIHDLNLPPGNQASTPVHIPIVMISTRTAVFHEQKLFQLNTLALVETARRKHYF